MESDNEGFGDSNSNGSKQPRIQPKCTICLQNYSNRTYGRPCFHSFCFHCICQWINSASSVCPICRQNIDSIVYNINEEKETFSEYFLRDKGNKKQHEPPLRRRNYMTFEQKKRIERKQLYDGELKVISYPEPLQKHRQLTVITPPYIPRTRIFLQRELRIVLNVDEVDEVIVQHIEQLLLLPFEEKKQTMCSSVNLQKLAEWLNDSVPIAERLVNELLSFLKSGLSYEQFINSIQYKAS